jgi:hypothetical protein
MRRKFTDTTNCQEGGGGGKKNFMGCYAVALPDYSDLPQSQKKASDGQTLQSWNHGELIVRLIGNSTMNLR